jgi:hypothetical protein
MESANLDIRILNLKIIMECIDKEDQMELLYLQIKTSTEIKVFWEVLKFRIVRIRMQTMVASIKGIK